MIHLFLSILSSTGIFFIFRMMDRQGTPVFPVIVINYLTAASLGFLCAGEIQMGELRHSPGFILLAISIGILFILMFFIVARSSREAGMGITTIASKMSVIFPMFFSIAYDPDDLLTPLKSLGIVLTLLGVLLTVYKKRSAVPKVSVIYLPVLLFLGMGVVDSLVKYSQFRFVNNDKLALFTALLFSISALSGLLILLIRPALATGYRHPRVILSGFLLGSANFGSIYFLVRALNHQAAPGDPMDSSVVFGINNIGIVCFSVLLGILIFGEKLSPLNHTGIVLCIAATLILAWSF